MRHARFSGSTDELTALAYALRWEGRKRGRGLARPAQLAPKGDWRIWLIISGRGWGKNRTANEWLASEIAAGRATRIALVGRTAADVRDTIVEGHSGILSIGDPRTRPTYEPSKRRVTWPGGAMATCYSADEPDLLRGPQHDVALADEVATWRYLEETWDNLMLGLRVGPHPRCIVTTTPRPRRLLRELLADPTCAVTRGSTMDNAENLPPSFLAEIKRKYEGTSKGRQEIHGELLDEAEGALWVRARIDAHRLAVAPQMTRIVIGVDPAMTAGDESNETGIVVCGWNGDHLYVLEDCSGRMSPDTWGRVTVGAYKRWRADRIVAEVNQGGDLVVANLRQVDRNVPVTTVHASRGKLIRAEPVAALYEQGRAHHVGVFSELEDQLCNYVPGEQSPDRLDALVHAATELMEGTSVIAEIADLDRGLPWDV